MFSIPFSNFVYLFENPEINDSRMAVFDLSMSGASDFDDFCIIVAYRFPLPFLIRCLLFKLIVASVSDVFLCLIFHITYHILSCLYIGLLNTRIFRVVKKESAARGLHFWDSGKTPDSHKNIQKRYSRADRQGARGKVSLTP